MREVFLEPLWKLPAVARYLISHPPDGYRFLTGTRATTAASQRAARHDIAYSLYNLAGKVVPINLAKAWSDRFAAPPGSSSLTWAVMHPVFRKEPWVLELVYEQPFLLVGHEPQFRRFKSVLIPLLESDCCRKIVCCDRIVGEALLDQLGASGGIEDKIEVVERAVPPQAFTKVHGDGKVRLLFVNSINLRHRDHFLTKGGALLLEAFARLSRRYPDLELVIRSALPPEFKARCRQLPSITVFEQPLSSAEFEQLWRSADIFVLPSHVTPDTALIEAMSYELPVVTTSVWANPNIVEHGKTGLLIDDPIMKPFSDGPTVHLGHPRLRDALRQVDGSMVEQLEESLRLLIENAGLRREMGRAARREVEEGRFSLARRNEKLKRVLDECCA